MTLQGREVTHPTPFANVALPHYPLNKGDLLYPQPDGTFVKIWPGQTLGGFVLLEERLNENTRPVNFVQNGMDYSIID